ncbi:MAG: TrkH family potassium uptake protein [Firmicutes bacterium]|jgi:trk system potassium uptake protein TrkH|nr:TrkH family potassium uptake protein [Bacillota bacterium]
MISKLISPILIVFSGVFLIPIFVGLIYGESIYSFIICGVFSLLMGLILRKVTRNVEAKLNLFRSMYFTAISWAVLSLIGCVPYIVELDKSFVDAFFESVSGFTTTGITVFTGLDTMANSVIMWRSITQCLGGLGILTFFLFITSSSEGDMWQLFGAEGHKISSSRPVPNVFATVRIFWFIYGTLIIVEAILLKILGLSVFDAINHSLTTLSTGGFSNHDLSIAYYKHMGYEHYKAIEYVIMLFMAFGGINFLVHYKFVKESKFAYFKDVESKMFFKIIAGATVLTLLGIQMSRGGVFNGIEENIRNTVFQMISVITTTGFGTVDIGSDFFPEISKQIFIILMVIGGSVGSTSGGIKVLRVIILEKIFKREINKLRLPRNAVLPVTLNKEVVSPSEVTRVSALVFGWIMLIIIGSFITVLFSDLNAFQGFSGMASAVGNIGPFYFSVDKMISLSPVIKYTYIIGMFAGRLELLPLFILFSKGITRRA